VTEKIVPWTELFRPQNLGEVLGNVEAVDALREWFDSWSPKAKRKAALLHGPAGTGKTSSVIALAKERGYELVEMNASDSRNKASILKIAGSSAKEGTLTNGTKAKRILLIDEVDGITGREDRGGVGSLIEVIRDASVPIICTANEAYASKLSPLRKVAKVIAYHPVHVEVIIKVLKKIGRIKKFELEADDVRFIAENAHGDIRSAINDLEGMIHQITSGNVKNFDLLKPNRDQTKHIQEVLTDLFHAKDFREGKRAVDGLKMKYDELLLWIFENAHLHTSDEKLPEVYTTIADADRFLGRIMRKQSWNLLSYFFDLVSGGVTSTIDNPSRHVEKYIYPQKISMYAQTRFSRALRDSIASSVAEKTHTSKRMAIKENMYLVKEILNGKIGNAAQLAYWLELDDNQMKSLIENQTTIKKIKQVMKAMDDDRIARLTQMGELRFSSFDDLGDDWTDILEVYMKKKEEMLAEEKRLKEEEKTRKAEARKAKKKAEKEAAKAAKTAKEKPTEEPKEEKEDEKKKQASLDQFF